MVLPEKKLIKYKKTSINQGDLRVSHANIRDIEKSIIFNILLELSRK